MPTPTGWRPSGSPPWLPVPARPSPPRYWGATCLVGILMLVVVGSGLFALMLASADEIASSLSGDAPPAVAVDGTVEVYPGVRVQLPPDWEPELTLADGVEISRRDATAHIVVREEPGPSGVIRDYVQELLVPDATGLSWTYPAQDRIGGRPAARATYAGFFRDVQEQIDGRLGAVEEAEWTVLVDAWGAEGQAPSQREVDDILESVEIDR